MKKFKVGDKVVRTGKDYKDIKKGGIYVVSEVSRNSNKWSCAINLEGHYNKNGEFEYEGNNFELYKEEEMEGKTILTPLQAAEAILNDEALEEYSNSRGEWCSFSCNLHGITLSYLQQVKLRLKPKTITINGVEVPAPAKVEDIKDYFYVLDISFETIHKVDKMYISNNKNYWATEEDAQKVLEVMLIPFNNLEKG